MKRKIILMVFVCLLLMLALTACNPPSISFKPLEEMFDGLVNGLASFGDNITHMFDNFLQGLPGPK